MIAKDNNTPSMSKLRHTLNNHLAVIGSYLAISERFELNDLYKKSLENAQKSYDDILKTLTELPEETT